MSKTIAFDDNTQDLVLEENIIDDMKDYKSHGLP